MNKSKLAVSIAVILAISLTGCNDENGSDIYKPPESDKLNENSNQINPYIKLYTQTTRPILDTTGKLIRDESGRVLVGLIENGLPTGEKRMELVDSSLSPVVNDTGEFNLSSVSFPLMDSEGYLIDDTGKRLITNAGLIGKPVTDNDGDLVFDADGAVLIDLYSEDGVLFGKKANSYLGDSGWTGKKATILVSEGETITNADGKAVTVNSKELEAVTTDGGDLVTT
ncbi:hypothetical protein, partial [Vibrio sonorensis]|uniref:hypothetical protein n=1 Tax=Vibrio sonorensis TaxID=1004316 RepID=UPI0011142BB0